ncbi:multiple C2 and transmembrane domain-containing protein 1-like [Etheostoma cragini]|uniref:multiple C2 and transmembrane domain-containing protein 1-like n=1 Tax=Etheostoma cragini TaxID=417921 RepID=UPI00155DFAFE|nr:multiple C2 and transmembrane domain-containing protein 1-like [Etheostoma cragini]
MEEEGGHQVLLHYWKRSALRVSQSLMSRLSADWTAGSRISTRSIHTCPTCVCVCVCYRTIPVTLVLKDSQHPDQDLGTLDLAVTLTPKDSPIEERRDSTQGQVMKYRWKPYVNKTMLLRRSWKRSTKVTRPHHAPPHHHHHHHHHHHLCVPLLFSINCPETSTLIALNQLQSVSAITVLAHFNILAPLLSSCQLDLSTLSKERTHHLELALEESRGSVVLLVTLTASAHVSIADLSVTPLDDPQERGKILRRYGVMQSFSNWRDVGIVQVKVMRAEGLMAADVTGKSDPFCVLELNNDRLQTHTVYKNLNPEWNKVFTFNVKDIHSVLEVTVFDEDRDRSADFLGKVAIPLLHVRNGERKSYVLKNKDLTGPTKGVLHLEMDVIYNTFKASLKTVVPAERKYIEEEPKVSKQLLQQNFNRVKRCIMVLISYGTYINSCFEWESAQRSIFSFVVFVVVVWNFELYMLPLALLLLLVWNYFFSSSRGTADSAEAVFDWEDEEEDKEDKESEPKGFMGKLYAIQDVFISVQSALDDVASYGERIKNTANWTVPFLSWLAIAALCLATVLLYLVPLRYLVLAWGECCFITGLTEALLTSTILSELGDIE